MTRAELITAFEQVYGTGGEIKTFFAPGRVNLIGEHTDYNGGYVFPCALTLGTYIAARKRTDTKLHFHSINFPRRELLESDLKSLVLAREDGWSNYPKGVVWAFSKWGMELDCGFDMILYGTIPSGSGLSSSASVELATGVMLCGLYGFEVDNQELALIGQYAENYFNGVKCGIMDQFAVAMGRQDHAIFLDTAKLNYSYTPVELGDASLIITYSNKRRGLSESKYNERRMQCEEAVSRLQSVCAIKTLGELSVEEFEEFAPVIQDPVLYRRARHAVYENYRTIMAVMALQQMNLKRFGELMYESHFSLRDDYEVTGVELDTLVDATLAQPGVLGSRMTGAGFGGCTVSIVNNNAIESMMENVSRIYRDRVGFDATFYQVCIGDGAREF